MRTLISAVLLSTVFSASLAYGENSATTPAPAAPAATAAGNGAPASPAEPMPLNTPAQALAANKALLSQDVHNIHSDAYKKQKDKAYALPRTPAELKKLQDKVAATQAQTGALKAKPADSKPILGSAIGAVPGDGQVSKAADGSPSFHPVMPTLKVNQTNIPNPDLSPLPQSRELHAMAPETGATAAPVTAELSDGSQAVFRPNGSVNIVTSDGKYHRPPDGVLTLKDGTSFTIEKGMRTEQ